MGKGGTRFVGDAIGVRAGKKRGTSFKDIKKEMEIFKETGKHPELEAARQRAANAVAQLPEKSTARPYVFLDITANKQPFGRVVVELFDDIAPVAVGHFRNRCSEGASDSFKGTPIHRIIRDQAIFGGKSQKYRGGMHMKRYAALRHVDRGAVSVSLAGDEFLIALTRCLFRDDTHQVVGRVSSGDDVLDRINACGTDSDDAPYQNIVVARSGFTNAAGTFEDFDEAGGGGRKESAEEAAQRLQRDADLARQALKDALATGMGQKRKAAEGVAAGGAGGTGAKKAATAGGGRGMLDTMLGDISSSGSESEEEGEGGAVEGGSDERGDSAGVGVGSERHPQHQQQQKQAANDTCV